MLGTKTMRSRLNMITICRVKKLYKKVEEKVKK